MELYPIRCKEILVPKPWGKVDPWRSLGKGNASKPPLAGRERIGESWEISTLPGFASRITNGCWSGRELGHVIARNAAGILGRQADRRFPRRFPLLVKWLSTAEELSVQVHPPSRQGGKHEAWYVWRAGGAARVYRGLKTAIGRDEWRRALRRNEPTGLLRSEAVRPGDVVPVPPRTVHALGRNLTVLEIQQPSDVTYRLYDWGRLGRALHVPKALRAMDFRHDGVNRRPPRVLSALRSFSGLRLRPGRRWRYRCPFFSFAEIAFDGALRMAHPGCSAQILVVLENSLKIHWGKAGSREEEILRAGQTVLIPAALREVRLVARRGKSARLLQVIPSASLGWAGRVQSSEFRVQSFR